jgi:F-type H+-transporting ATPase subunit epsilon
MKSLANKALLAIGASAPQPERRVGEDEGIMTAFKTTIAAPDRTVLECQVESLVAPGLDGYFGVLPGHAPMIAGISRGILKMVGNGEENFMVVGDGLLRIEDKAVHILVEDAIKASDLADAEEKLERKR